MARYIVRYEYEMPGWDEFGKTADDSIIVEADSQEGALAAFKALEAANTERNSLKFSFHPHTIEEV